MKNLLRDRGSLASVSSQVASRMGTSERNLYRSVEASRVGDLNDMIDVNEDRNEELSEISTSRNKSQDRTEVFK